MRSFIDGLIRKLKGHSNCERAIPRDSNDARDCVLVIDASGSMLATDWKPSRLKAAQEAAKAFCKRLAEEEPDANVAVVSYGDYAKVHCSLVSAALQKKLARRIELIDSRGCTNITDGLKKAFNILQGSRKTCQTVLLTDGHHNTGPSPARIANKLKKSVIIECVGIGGSPRDVDEELLEEIASEYPDGTKRYRWIGDKERLVQHFHKLAGRITRA